MRLPTVVGWEWHLRQRGQSLEQYRDRVADLEDLYESSDAGLRRAVLDRYDVRWVVVGDLERKTYDLRSHDPLAGVPGVKRWASDGETILYRVFPCTSHLGTRGP